VQAAGAAERHDFPYPVVAILNFDHGNGHGFERTLVPRIGHNGLEA
jgi:hypothetical protein